MGSWRIHVLGGGVGDESIGAFHIRRCASGQGPSYGSGVRIMVTLWFSLGSR